MHWHNVGRRVIMVIGVCVAGSHMGASQAFQSAAGIHARALQSVRLHMDTTRAERETEKCGFPAVTHAFAHRYVRPGILWKEAEVLLTRPAMQKSVRVGDYRVHYDTAGAEAAALLDPSFHRIPGTADAFADSVCAILSRVLPAEVGELGYLPPPQDGTEGGGPEYDVYILELGNVYGYTTPEGRLNTRVQGATYTSFMSIDNDFEFVSPDSNKGLPALRVTVAHELFHAIQVGQYAYWFETEDEYFYEMCSTWMEDVVFPGVNDYVQYLFAPRSQFRSPDLPFTTSNGLVEYSRAIWAHYVAKVFGRDAVKRFWEDVRSVPPLQAMDNVLREYGSSFRTAFAEWTLWNYFTGARADTVRYYPEGNLYPLITQMGADYVPPSRDINGTLTALSARYYDVMWNGDRLTLALSNLNLAAGVAKSRDPFPYTYRLNANQVDDSYQPTGAGIYVKLDVTDQTNWYSWNIVQGAVGPVALTAGSPFPDPFRADGRVSVHVPTTAVDQVTGRFSVFSSGVELVYSATLTSSLQLGKQVFSWTGCDEQNELVPSGIYFYVLEFGNQLLKGKFALIRK